MTHQHPMLYLIDGYNLMHAVGMAPKPGRASLERARLRMIEWLAVELGKDVPDVCVVFDAVHLRGQSTQVHRGIHVQFSNGETADDLIENWIRESTSPKQLTIVSNDNRLRQAAVRRSCIAWTCGDLVDWLAERKRVTAPVQNLTTDKPDAPSAEEMDEWLKAFAPNVNVPK